MIFSKMSVIISDRYHQTFKPIYVTDYIQINRYLEKCQLGKKSGKMLNSNLPTVHDDELRDENTSNGGLYFFELQSES